MANDIAIFSSDLHKEIAKQLIQNIPAKTIALSCVCNEGEVYEVKNSLKYAQFCYNSAIHKLMTQGAVTAVNTLINIANNEYATASARVAASDKIMTHLGRHFESVLLCEKELAEMTQKELHEHLEILTKERLARKESGKRVAEAVIDNLKLVSKPAKSKS